MRKKVFCINCSRYRYDTELNRHRCKVYYRDFISGDISSKLFDCGNHDGFCNQYTNDDQPPVAPEIRCVDCNNYNGAHSCWTVGVNYITGEKYRKTVMCDEFRVTGEWSTNRSFGNNMGCNRFKKGH